MHSQPSLLNAQLNTHLPPHTHLVTRGVRTLYAGTLFPGHQSSLLPPNCQVQGWLQPHAGTMNLLSQVRHGTFTLASPHYQMMRYKEWRPLEVPTMVRGNEPK